jgi:hypothetical protein
MKPLHKVLLFAVLPALIAGGFSVAPKIYEELNRPSASLIYDITVGPAIRAGDSYQQIYSLSITNQGKVVLSEIAGTFRLNSGKIENFAFDDNSNLKPTIELNEDNALIEIQRLHPTEKFKVSVLINVPETTLKPEFILRSKEVLGQISSTIDSSNTKKSKDLLGGILASLSVFLMSLLLLKTGGNPFGFIHSKQDTLVYIAALANVKEITDEVRLSQSSITYLRMADLFLAAGLGSDDEKCLLLIKSIAEKSVWVITHNLEILEGTDYLEDETKLLRSKSVGVDKIILLRQNIQKFCDSPTAFLSS